MTSNVWFTSDLHLNHGFVAHLRGFDSPAAHDEYLCDSWAADVRKDDLVWVLGDSHVGQLAESMQTIKALPGRKRLILGNHDTAHPAHSKPTAHHKYAEAFELVTLATQIKIAGKKVLLHHMPYTGDHTIVQRFAQWRLPDLGMPLLHGHTHSHDRTTCTELGTLQVHVGQDAWDMQLVNLDTITQMLTKETS